MANLDSAPQSLAPRVLVPERGGTELAPFHMTGYRDWTRRPAYRPTMAETDEAAARRESRLHGRERIKVHEPLEGCFHRTNYSVLVGLQVEMTLGALEGPPFRLGPTGVIIFADKEKEQAFQDWYVIKNGTTHSEPCEQRAVWQRGTGLPLS